MSKLLDSPAIVAVTPLRRILEDASVPYQRIVLGLSVGVWLFETYINVRQLPHLKLRSPPPSLAPYLASANRAPTTDAEGAELSKTPEEPPQDVFLKSQSYALDKLKYKLCADVVNQLETWALLSPILAPLFSVPEGKSWSGLSGLWGLAETYTDLWAERAPSWAHWGTGEIPTTLTFVVLLSLAGMITSIPSDLYRKFVLEEKHGFNKQTIGLWISDQVKGAVLSALFGLPLVAGLVWVIKWAGEAFVQYCMLGVMVLCVLLHIFYPYVIAPMFNKFRHLSEFPEYKEVEDLTHALSKRIGFPLGRLWVIDGSKRSSHSNAFFFGLPGLTKHIVLYDTLLKQATPAQVEAILAHELGHWKLFHTLLLLGTAQFQIAFSLSVFRFFIWNPALFSAFGFYPLANLAGSPPTFLSLDTPSATYPILVGLLLAQQLFTPLNAIVVFLMHGLSRKLEYQADAFAKSLGYAGPLKAALVKISAENKATTGCDWLYSAFHHSHPTLPERLARLDEGAEDKKTQ